MKETIKTKKIEIERKKERMSYREAVEREKHEVIGKGRVRTEKGKKTKKETYN